MLDVVTVQACFTLVATSLLVLFYVATYRSTHASFCGWWCISLALFLLTSAVWMAAGATAPAVLIPLGNALGVAGAVSVWVAARSLAATRPPWWLLAVLPLATALAAAAGDPGTDEWSGGLVFLTAMTIAFCLAARELWLVRSVGRDVSPSYVSVATALAAASTLIAAYYVARTVIYAVVGPDDPLFADMFGTTTTTMFTTAMLVTVSYSMSSLSNEQRVHELQGQAARDDLTGLLHRRAFLELAETQLHNVSRAALIVADLDRFKRINDELGHLAGDEVLRTFARVCQGVTRSTDLVARYGGEEFVLLLPGAWVETAETVCRAISRMLRSADPLHGAWTATVSFGITELTSADDLTEALGRADAALYEAKAAGRDRFVTNREDGGRTLPMPPPAVPRATAVEHPRRDDLPA